MKSKISIGIDEVGRGPIAGPVAVGAFVFKKPEARRFFRGVRESKQLTEEKREEWFAKILEARTREMIDFHVAFQSQKIIDSRGISWAIRKCIETCLTRLSPEPRNTLILLDGGLKAPVRFKKQKTIVRGDTKEMIIALASICAKVLRDRKMRQWAKIHPGYDFENNKGYGTKTHYEMVKRMGLSDLHRKSYCK